MRYNADADPMFSPAAIDLVPDQYCPGQDRRNPLLSPLFGNWNGLPPLLFHAGSTETLLDDSVRGHDRAVQAGVAAGIEVWPDVPHVFHVFGWLPEAKDAMSKLSAFLAAPVEQARESGSRLLAEERRDLVERAIRVGEHA
jgi:acetyl esterase/lipase